MGGGGSQTIKQTFDMKVINKSIFNQITTNQQSLSASMNNTQRMEIDIGEMGENCSVTVGQTIDATGTSSAVMSPKTIAETKDMVQSELQAAASAALEKTTELGNFQFGDKQNVDQKITMEIENVVEKTFETNNMNEIISAMVTVQDGKLRIEKCNGKLNLNQDIVAALMAEAITESLTSAISDNEMLNSLAAAADATAKSENKGISDLVDSLSGPLMASIAASVLCVCIIILAVLSMMLSPAGQKATGTMANAGASRVRGGRF